MNQKIEITKYVIEKLNLNCPNEESFKLWVKTIWQNPRIKDFGGLYLTKEGFRLLKQAEIKCYDVRLDNDTEIQFNNKFILWLDQNFDCPLYITKNFVHFFNEKPAVQLVLFSGNLQQFFQAHQTFQEKQLDKI